VRSQKLSLLDGLWVRELIVPIPQRLEGLAQIQPPRTKKELRKIWGVFGYYREYIPHYSEIAQPMTDLTSSKVPNVLGDRWSEDCQSSLVRLEAAVLSPHVMRVPVVGRPFVLHTDASGRAVGASLKQRDEKGVEQPLAFASQKLTPTQAAWTTIEREAYAVIWALNKYRDLIFGTRVTVCCDYNFMQYIKECAPKSAKLMRWSLALQEFDVDFQYQKGSSNVVADWLSRSV